MHDHDLHTVCMHMNSYVHFHGEKHVDLCVKPIQCAHQLWCLSAAKSRKVCIGYVSLICTYCVYRRYLPTNRVTKLTTRLQQLRHVGFNSAVCQLRNRKKYALEYDTRLAFSIQLGFDMQPLAKFNCDVCIVGTCRETEPWADIWCSPDQDRI